MKYTLEVRAVIRKVDAEGYYRANESMSVEQTHDLGELGFVDIARILGSLEEAVNAVKGGDQS